MPLKAIELRYEITRVEFSLLLAFEEMPINSIVIWILGYAVKNSFMKKWFCTVTSSQPGTSRYWFNLVNRIPYIPFILIFLLTKKKKLELSLYLFLVHKITVLLILSSHVLRFP